MKAEISLQIPVKDGGDNFRVCLDSLRKQKTEGIFWDLIIVDDGSWIKPVFSRPATPPAVAMRVLVRLAIFPPAYRCVLRWMEKFGKPSFLFTYLSAGGCLTGLCGRNFE